MVERADVEHWLYLAAGSPKGIILYSENPHGLCERFRHVRADLREESLANLEFLVIDRVDGNVLVRQKLAGPLARAEDLGI